MTHTNLIGKVAAMHDYWMQAFHHMEYEGNLTHVISRIGNTLLSDKKNRDDYVRLFVDPPRVIRGLIDYKIQNPQAKGIESLIVKADEMCQKIYRQDEEASTALLELRRTIAKAHPGVLKQTIKQIADEITWEATRPKRNLRTAEYLHKEVTGGEDMLFIPLAHGGISAGIQVFNHYQDLTGRESTIYPVRFSMRKYGDNEPQVNEVEKELLRMAKDKHQITILFDEDIVTGLTAKRAKSFFSELLGYNVSGSQIELVTNTNLKFR
ncbi:hypothetical protein JW711_01145 [Candidatus Woesearchaeota archaeon]|nr:hypothetical protein [Candidatus Woesearchaeota archaeon]